MLIFIALVSIQTKNITAKSQTEIFTVNNSELFRQRTRESQSQGFKDNKMNLNAVVQLQEDMNIIWVEAKMKVISEDGSHFVSDEI